MQACWEALSEDQTLGLYSPDRAESPKKELIPLLPITYTPKTQWIDRI